MSEAFEAFEQWWFNEGPRLLRECGDDPKEFAMMAYTAGEMQQALRAQRRRDSSEGWPRRETM